MPTLHWVGKDKVVNHHHDVPFRLLDKQYTFTANEGAPAPLPQNSTANRIIHGDNLEALKSLLPEFEGKVNCIYIDPPYNTGNEGWVYNDAVNDPKIKKWLGQVVGKEGEDLSRHDKWLCMMYPRLKLLHRLLADDGVIFVSIDDNEQATLKLVMDEIFGAGNFVANVVWRSSDNSNNDAKQFSTDHNHLVIFSKQKGWSPIKAGEQESKRSHFKNPDNDPRGPWFDGNPLNSPKPRPNLTFSLFAPDGTEIRPPANGWRWSLETINQKISTGEIKFTPDNRSIRRRTYLADMEALPPSTLWIDLEETGHNRQAKSEQKAVFSEIETRALFDTPKPTAFLTRLLEISVKSKGIVLDSFAGSGTTAHAVLKLNAQDGGNRRFILCEMMDYAETITAERVRRVMNGYGEGSKTQTGTGGAFDYYTVGAALFKEDKNLNEDVGEAAIRDYVAYTESIPAAQQSGTDNPVCRYMLGASDTALWLFYYERDKVTTLNLDFLASLNIKAFVKNGGKRPEHFIIYADKCALDKEFLTKHGITFKRIPRDITRF
ncbi:MAG: hypothetical protein RL462_1133 [Pseudomonadota bacterium]|jgi:adenine-specific DNA-methyltransferase